LKYSVAIIGTRGIPASYSGFETSVQETATRFVQNNIKTTVFCRKNHYHEYPAAFNDVNLIYISSIKSKHLDTITNTLFSVVHLFLNRYDIIVVYGVGNAVYIPLLRLIGYPVIAVVDGADWDRQKWGNIAKWFLRISRWFAVKFSNFYVVDNEYLAQNYQTLFNKAPIYIPYGANLEFSNKIEMLSKFNVIKNKYVIFVGRFVKEKGIDFLINNYCQVDTDIKLVLVGDNDLDIEYVNYLKSLANDNVIFTGFLYGAEYETLLHNALFYVSCSFLEGTSPSLLSAMSLNGFALVSDIIENKEVLKSSCSTFKVGNSNDFIERLKYYLSNSEIIEKERANTKNIVQNYYTWDKITDQYIKLFNILINNKF